MDDKLERSFSYALEKLQKSAIQLSPFQNNGLKVLTSYYCHWTVPPSCRPPDTWWDGCSQTEYSVGSRGSIRSTQPILQIYSKYECVSMLLGPTSSHSAACIDPLYGIPACPLSEFTRLSTPPKDVQLSHTLMPVIAACCDGGTYVHTRLNHTYLSSAPDEVSL